VSLTTNVANLAEFEVRSVAAVCNAVLCAGGKLLISGVRSFRRFRRLGRLEVDGCARVLGVLAVQSKRTAYTDLVARLPGLDPVKAFEDLRYIDGVLFLVNDPPGLTLQPELRDELRRLLAHRA
jgi:hypothetical protein